MRIVFILNKLNIGGPQKIVAFLSNRMAKLGHEVYVLVYTDKHQNLFFEKKVTIHSLDYDAEIWNKRNVFNKRVHQLSVIKDMRRAIIDINPEIVCVFTISLLRIAQTALAGLNFPIIASERGNPFDYSPKLFKTAYNSYSKSAFTIFQTSQAKELFKLDNSCVIPNPAISRGNNEVTSKSGIDNLIITAGRLEPEKGFDLLISCMQDVQRKVNCYLKVYGSGSQHETLQHLIDKMELQERIELSGESADFINENSDAIAFVLPSYSEGMPNVLIEAMMARIPCIATDCSSGGPRFLLNDGNAGLLVPVGNKELLSEAIVSIVNSPKKRNQLTRAANEVLEKLNEDNVFYAWMKVFELVYRNRQ